jgi:DNA-binding transcriptional ArsR family regulator
MSAGASSGSVDATRIARVLAHPLRHRILLEYHAHTTSPSRVATALELRLNVVAYHTGELLKHGCIELVRTVRRRGAVEHYYRATAAPVVGDELWHVLPAKLRRGMTQNALATAWRDARTAAVTSGFDVARAHLSRTPLVLDEAGAARLAGMLRDVLAEATRLDREARDRGADTHDCELVMLFFDVSPSPTRPA